MQHEAGLTLQPIKDIDMKSSQNSNAAVITAGEAETLLRAIASHCAGARQILENSFETIDGSDPAAAAALIQAASCMVGVAGWLADSGLRHVSEDTGVYGPADRWLAGEVPQRVFRAQAA
mgnify:CR=1 FL=1